MTKWNGLRGERRRAVGLRNLVELVQFMDVLISWATADVVIVAVVVHRDLCIATNLWETAARDFA